MSTEVLPVDATDPAPNVVTQHEEISSPNDSVKNHDIEADIEKFVDSGAENFDPLIHAIDKVTGQPKRRGDGSFALKRGRKSGSTASTVPRETPQVDTSEPQIPQASQESGAKAVPAALRISNEEAARQFCNLAIGGAVMMLGTEWEPTSKEESKFLVTSVKNYFDAKGQIQLSPEWGLAIAVLAYSAPRLRHENTRTKITRGLLWVKEKVVGIRALLGRK